MDDPHCPETAAGCVSHGQRSRPISLHDDELIQAGMKQEQAETRSIETESGRNPASVQYGADLPLGTRRAGRPRVDPARV